MIDRGSGYWYCKVAGDSSYKSTGIQIRTNRQGKPTNRHEAEQYAMEQADRRLLERDRGVTLGQFLQPFYGPDCPRCSRLATDGRPITEKHRKIQRQRIKTYVLEDPLSRVRMADLSPGDIEEWKRRQVAAGVGAPTINPTLYALSGAFAEAVHRGDMVYNPVASIGSVVVQGKAGYGVFSPEELRPMLIDEVRAWGYDSKDGTRSGLDWRPGRLFALLVATIGERPSAIRLLQWRHYQDDTLTFPLVKDRRKNGRTVPLTSYAVAALDGWRGNAGPDDPIFGYPAGGSMGESFFQKRFGHMMRVLQLPELDPWGNRRVMYSLKYTLETELIDRGANPALVRDLMGHSHQRGEPDTILTPVQARYRRHRVDALRELVPMIEELFKPGNRVDVEVYQPG